MSLFLEVPGFVATSTKVKGSHGDENLFDPFSHFYTIPAWDRQRDRQLSMHNAIKTKARLGRLVRTRIFLQLHSKSAVPVC